MIDVFDKVIVEDFNLSKFMNEYNCENNEYDDYSILENIDAIWLKDLFIKDEFKNKGYGTGYIEDIKKQGKPIVLYSIIEAHEYWEKLGFECIISEHVYMWNVD